MTASNYMPKWLRKAGGVISGVEDACNIHDLCYDSCLESQLSCDREYKALGHSICDDRKDNKVEKESCKAGVDAMFELVRKFGKEAYDESQARNGC